MRAFSSATAAMFLLASTTTALAQSVPRDRGFVSINGGYRVSSSDFHDQATFRANAEDGRFDTDYRVASGPTFDVFGALLITPRFGVGGGVSRYSRSTPTAFVGSVPHPFFFDRARPVSSEVTGLRREELTIHVQAHHVLPVSRALQVTLFGGPSFFRMMQGVIVDFEYGDAYPFEAVSFQRAKTADVTAWAAGFNAGGDFTVFLTDRLGIGFSAQYTGGTADLPSANGGSTAVKAGGVSTGVGLRLRF